MSSVDDILEYYDTCSTIFLNVDASSTAICDKIFLSRAISLLLSPLINLE